MTTSHATVRPYLAGDRGQVIAMLADSDPWKQLGYRAEHWERLFNPFPAGRDGFVIQVDAPVIGIALVRRQFLFGDYLELLAIAPRAQGCGLGGALLGAIEQDVLTRSKNLFACVSDFNVRAREFYRRRGYQEIGPIPDLLMPGSSEILLRKSVGPARSAC